MTEPSSRVGRFGGLAKAARARGDGPADAEALTTAAESAHQAEAPRQEPAKRGAKVPKVGKSKREDYRQTTIYLHAERHADAVDKLRAEQRRAKKGAPRRDLSDIIGALLDGWVSGRFTV